MSPAPWTASRRDWYSWRRKSSSTLWQVIDEPNRLAVELSVCRGSLKDHINYTDHGDEFNFKYIFYHSSNVSVCEDIHNCDFFLWNLNITCYKVKGVGVCYAIGLIYIGSIGCNSYTWTREFPSVISWFCERCNIYDLIWKKYRCKWRLIYLSC